MSRTCTATCAWTWCARPRGRPCEASGDQSNAVDVENEREWTRATCDRDTLLLRETLGNDHAFLDQKRTEDVVVTR